MVSITQKIYEAYKQPKTVNEAKKSIDGCHTNTIWSATLRLQKRGLLKKDEITKKFSQTDKTPTFRTKAVNNKKIYQPNTKPIEEEMIKAIKDVPLSAMARCITIMESQLAEMKAIYKHELQSKEALDQIMDIINGEKK